MELAKPIAVGVIRPWERRLGVTVGIVAFILLLAVVAIPSFDGPYMRQAANEASTVGAVRTLTTFQQRYAATFASRGYACEFPKLHPIGPQAVELDEWWYLSESVPQRSGYRLSIRDCVADSDGHVRHYALVAVPVIPGKSGFRAFCSDESGVIYYDKSGSAADCLTRKNPLN